MDATPRHHGLHDAASPTSARSVLIVGPSEETREVLQCALADRGVRTMSAMRAAEGLALAREHRPDLIVLDLDVAAERSTAASEVALSENFAEASPARATPLVMLGTARRRDPGLPAGQFVAKPYHYAPLIRKIESLLEAAG